MMYMAAASITLSSLLTIYPFTSEQPASSPEPMAVSTYENRKQTATLPRAQSLPLRYLVHYHFHQQSFALPRSVIEQPQR